MRGEAWLEVVLFALAAAFGVFGFGLPAVSFGGGAPGTRDAGVVRVVTWNVGGTSGGRPRGMDDQTLGAVAQTLRELDADLIALQEVSSPQQFGALQSALEATGPGWRGFRTSSGVVVFARGFEVDFAGEIEGVRRSQLLGLIRDGERFAVAAVHADAFDAERRNIEVGRAAEVLFGATADHLILLGDFNLDVDLDKRRDLFSDDSHLDVETYNYVARVLQDAAAGRGATAEPDRRLDYVFVSGGMLVESSGPWKGRRVGPMDHDPVWADLRLP